MNDEFDVLMPYMLLLLRSLLQRTIRPAVSTADDPWRHYACSGLHLGP